jgi:YD repeat-containing protein
LRAWTLLIVCAACDRPDPDDPWAIVDAIEAARAEAPREDVLLQIPRGLDRDACVVRSTNDVNAGQTLLRWYDAEDRPLVSWNGRAYVIWERDFDRDGVVLHVRVRRPSDTPWNFIEEDYARGRIVSRETSQMEEAWTWSGDSVSRYWRWDKVDGPVDEFLFDDLGRLVATREYSGPYLDSETTYEWNADGTLAREYADYGRAFGETVWTWTETEGIGQGYGENAMEGTSSSWTSRWQREDGRLVAAGDAEDPSAWWTWDGDRVVAFGNRAGDRHTWAYDADGHIVEQVVEDADSTYMDRVDRWTWEGDRLRTHRVEYNGHAGETTFSSRCPPSAWAGDLADVIEPVMVRMPEVGVPYE